MHRNICPPSVRNIKDQSSFGVFSVKDHKYEKLDSPLGVHENDAPLSETDVPFSYNIPTISDDSFCHSNRSLSLL